MFPEEDLSLTHKCPGPQCRQQIPYHRLACAPHWYQVPRPIRNAVYRAWKGGQGAGTTEHAKAMIAAIARMRPLAS